MSDTSFVVKFTRTKVRAPAVAIRYENHYLAKNEALNFCVVLRNMGGEVIEMVQYLCGREDAVLDGPALEKAVERQSIRISEDADPPWL